jgi:phospholipase C
MNLAALLGLLSLAAAVSAAPPKAHNSRAHSSASISNLKSKIKNVVILEMENRSVDNLLGGQTIKGLENPINNGPFCNPYNLTDASSGQVCSSAKDFDSILDDPAHSVTGNNIEFYGTFTPSNADIAQGTLTPSQQGFVHEQLRRYGDDVNKTELAKQVLNYYTEDEVPVLTTLVQNYLTFNHWHSDHPGVSAYQTPLSIHI